MCGVEGVRRGRRRRGRAEEEEGGIQVHERRPLFMGRVGPRVGLHGSAVQRQRKASPKKARSTASRASRLLFLFSRWNIHRLAGLRVLLLPAHGSRSADAHEAWAGVGSILLSLCRARALNTEFGAKPQGKFETGANQSSWVGQTLRGEQFVSFFQNNTQHEPTHKTT